MQCHFIPVILNHDFSRGVIKSRIHILFQLMDLTEIVSHELMNSSVDHHLIFILQYKVWKTCLCTELKGREVHIPKKDRHLRFLKRLKKGYEKAVFVYLLPEDMKFVPDFNFSISGCRTNSAYQPEIPLLAKIYDFLQGGLPDQDFIVDLVSLSTKQFQLINQ